MASLTLHKGPYYNKLAEVYRDWFALEQSPAQRMNSPLEWVPILVGGSKRMRSRWRELSRLFSGDGRR